MQLSYTLLFKVSKRYLIDSEAMRARGIIVLVKSNQLVKNIETKQLKLAKRYSAAVVLVFKAGAFRNQWSRLLAVPQDGHVSETSLRMVTRAKKSSEASETSLSLVTRAKKSSETAISLSPVLPSLDSTEEGLLAVYQWSITYSLVVAQ